MLDLRPAALQGGVALAHFTLQHAEVARNAGQDALVLEDVGVGGGQLFLEVAGPLKELQSVVALAKTAGRAVLRFADADYLPLTFSNFADTVGRYVGEVMKLASDERETILEKNRRISDKTFESAADPTKPFVAPKPEAPAPFLNFAPLQNALTRLQESTQRYDAAMRDPASAVRLQSRDVQRALDSALNKVEHAMTSESGLPRRSWFKHEIYAPGFYTGYGVKTLPAIREALEQHNWPEAAGQIEVVAHTLDNTAIQMDRAAAILKGSQ